jgi:Zn-dependent protease
MQQSALPQWGQQGVPPQWGQPQQGAPPQWGQPQQPYYAAPDLQNASFLERKKSQGGIVGAIASVLLLLAKFGTIIFALLGKLKFLVIVGKLLLTSGTMLLSMWAYAQLFGWPFGIGMVMLIFIHECGHALAARIKGIPTSFMVFVPFMGAAVFTKRYGQDIVVDAFIGIMGPVVGTLASAVCAVIGIATGQPFWLALAEWGFLINLFNLIPTAPLDGGWIVPLFSPKLLAVGVILLVWVGFYNPLIWILGLLSLPRIVGGWKADPATQPYYRVPPMVRVKYGLSYAGLAAALALGWVFVRGYLQAMPHVVM